MAPLDVHEPVHAWFGLTYSNYLVLPRAVLQSMPEEWQARFVAMLDELRASCEAAGLECHEKYRVHAVDARGKSVKDPVPHYRHAPNLLESRPPQLPIPAHRGGKPEEGE